MRPKSEIFKEKIQQYYEVKRIIKALMFSYIPFKIKFNSETFEVEVFDSPSRADDRQKECWLVSSSNEG